MSEHVIVVKAPKKFQNGMNNLIDVRLRVTQGKVMAMMNALEAIGESSPVGQDLLDMLRRSSTENAVVI